MNSNDYRGYPRLDEDGKWCVWLGPEKGRQRFDTLAEATEALRARLEELDAAFRQPPPPPSDPP